MPNGGYDIDPYEANKAISVAQQAFTIGSGGFVDVPVTLTKSHAEGGLNQIVAAAHWRRWSEWTLGKGGSEIRPNADSASR